MKLAVAYRFWRDFDYGIGALLIGVVAETVGMAEATFWFVAVAMGISGAFILLVADETHPEITARANRPASQIP